MDVIEDYIYDLFAQRVDMMLAREKIREFLTNDKLQINISRMRAHKRKYLYKFADAYRYYHKPYKDNIKIVRDEWVWNMKYKTHLELQRVTSG